MEETEPEDGTWLGYDCLADESFDPLDARIVMTPEMVAAGVKAAWTAPNPPQIVEDQVRKNYLAMEAEKYRQGLY